MIRYLFFLFLCVRILAQDTLSVMAYNILYYLSTDANRFRYKDIRQIIQHTRPDVAMFCEVVDTQAPKLLLDSAFNAAGVGTYTRAAFFNGLDTDNLLFYKPSKVKLLSQKQIYTSLRDISQYVVYRNKANGDTVKLYLHMAHLKAGSTSADEMQRNSEVNAFCNEISSLPATVAVVFGGDLNFKNSSEPAWNTLSSGSLCAHTFFDPANQVGSWTNNMMYAHVHTQSTRSSAFPGCCGGVTGGLDDRFDFLLINQGIHSGNGDVTYVPGSYYVVGNDGQHFNLSLKEGSTNTVVPPAVNDALFNVSDHLPVMMKLILHVPPVGLTELQIMKEKTWQLFYAENSWELWLGSEKPATLTLMDLWGKKIFESEVLPERNGKIKLSYGEYVPGIYFIRVKQGDTEQYFKAIAP